MKYLLSPILSFYFFSSGYGQPEIPRYFTQKKNFNEALHKIVHEVGLDSTWNAGEDGMETISFAVIDLNSKHPVLGCVNCGNFIYPASVYKMYVAMEILRQVSNGDFSLSRQYIVKSPNDVDRSKEISYDPRPLLRAGDTVTINYLLDLMITRSDNAAANCLIDVATRDSINRTIHEMGWYGSEVTRKFLSRKLEDPGYDTIKSTETCALHAADFMYKVYKNELINPWVSRQMKALLGRQLDTTKLSLGLPHNTMYYHKTGWWSIYTNDVGIVEDGNIKYIIALFTPVTEEKVSLQMKELSDRVYNFISLLHH
ncbi:serine hydrolase [Ginsengibacter hankyongi]|uniref:beta-lactamase n=1 Tax=Ginsengibacter hankyongi TaxID=2607284 RepID=A0A5J5IHT8_9BACT|nr:serine hydrolase [Ginsengibacter hankyongi]KAA9038171.1 serine hydrolase [Ginsengibacter hankyongi]